MKILILEDEIPAYQKLASLIKAYFNTEVSLEWARTVLEGKQLLQESKYDLILSDIQLLDGKSFEIFEITQVNAPIIFCSAFDEYLFDAFKTNGIAYVLKPYTQKDFNSALEKYRALFKSGEYESINLSALESIKSVFNDETIQYKKRFVIKKTKGIQLLNVSDISLIQASGDFCIATDTQGKRHTMSLNLGSIYNQLNPKKFFKINRSEIVQIDAIERLENHFKNRLILTLIGSKDKVMTSTASTSEFRKWLEQ